MSQVESPRWWRGDAKRIKNHLNKNKSHHLLCYMAWFLRRIFLLTEHASTILHFLVSKRETNTHRYLGFCFLGRTKLKPWNFNILLQTRMSIPVFFQPIQVTFCYTQQWLSPSSLVYLQLLREVSHPRDGVEADWVRRLRQEESFQMILVCHKLGHRQKEVGTSPWPSLLPPRAGKQWFLPKAPPAKGRLPALSWFLWTTHTYVAFWRLKWAFFTLII